MDNHVIFADRYAQVVRDFPDAGDRFENTIKAVYTTILKSGSIALDCGAHVGKHALPMARLVGPTGQVYAFEPIPEKFCMLSANIGNARLTNIQPFNVCCLDQNKLVIFTYLPTDPGKSSIHVRSHLESSQVEKVRRSCVAIKLDDFFIEAPRIDFMKVDTEGAELHVLRGALGLVQKQRPVIHVEIGEPSCAAFGYRPDEIYSLLQRNGYEVFDILGYPLESVDRFNESASARGVYDYIAIASGDSRRESILEACFSMWRPHE